MIHIALCFTDTTGSYYKHALVTVASILDNTSSPLCLHLIHDDTLSKHAATCFVELCKRHDQELRLHHAGEIPEATRDNVIAQFGKGALYRMLLPRLLEVDKVLYFDCDIVCLADVQEIFHYDISPNYLGAVAMESEQSANWQKRLRLTCGFCINTGVLLMNLDKIRDSMQDFEERLFAIIENFPTKIGDQDAINILYDTVSNAYLLLPGFCNLRTEQKDHSTWPLQNYYGNVIHFAGKKPWQTLTPPSLFYWKYYARLFPCEDVFEMMEHLEPYEHAYLFSFIMQKDKRRRMVNRCHNLVTKGLRKTLLQRICR